MMLMQMSQTVETHRKSIEIYSKAHSIPKLAFLKHWSKYLNNLVSVIDNITS